MLFKRLLKPIVMVSVLVFLIALAAPVMAAPASHTHSPVQRFSDGTVVEGSEATLTRTDNGVALTINTSELEPGAAFTVWWIVFNNPEYCSGGSCGEDDLFDEYGMLIVNDDGTFGTPGVDASVLFATGHVLGNNGNGNFGASLKEGQVKGALFGPGMRDAREAEVHNIVRSHGQPIPGIVDEMISTVGGGCNEATGGGPGAVGNDCEDIQFAVFLP
jgi:hypothetical protein